MARPPMGKDSFASTEDVVSESDSTLDSYITITGDNATINIYI